MLNCRTSCAVHQGLVEEVGRGPVPEELRLEKPVFDKGERTPAPGVWQE
jgi:hypothetical protein